MSESLVDGGHVSPVVEITSPGLADNPELGRAFELKFLLSYPEADAIEAWAREHLSPDTHGVHGTYRVASVYCDTPAFDVFHRSKGYRRSKFRLRRYGESSQVFLERKTRKGDRVRKKRVVLPAEQLAWLAEHEMPEEWAGFWFRKRLVTRGLQPICQVGYQRTAFGGMSGTAPVRLTLDRHLVGAAVRGWELPQVENGEPLLPEGALLELKYHVTLPSLFLDLLPRLPDQGGRVSKYRRCVERCGLVQPIPRADEPGTGGTECLRT